MSRFIERLNSVSQGGMAPMGFRAAGAKPRPRMLLVAHGAGTKATGADALLLTAAKAPKGRSAIPWGGWLKEVSASMVKKLGEGDADFVVFPADSVSKSILEEEGLGKVVEVEPDIEAGMLKAIDGLPVDAVLIAGERASLTWQDLMLLRRAANMLTKPLLVTVSPDITASELQALCEAGVSGVVAGANLDRLRKAIDKLPAPKAAKSRAEPLVPRVRGGVPTAAEEEEED